MPDRSTISHEITRTPNARGPQITLGRPTPAFSTVALLYKRNAPHAAHLIDLLTAELEAAGYEIFIDRHLQVGIEWAQELKRQVSAAYAVVPLLSAESIWSEMLESEVQTAYEAAQHRDGLPHLLPVRIAYEGPLPDGFAHILDPLQYVLWRGPEDDASLVQSLLSTLRAGPSAPQAPQVFDPVGGAVPLDSRFYIVRASDDQFKEALARRDSIVLVKGARQMGKTSLLTRSLQLAREAGATCFRTDFQKLTMADMQSEEAFFRTLAEMLADQLDLPTQPGDAWNSNRSGAFNFERYLRREVLGVSKVPVVWALDEVDRLFTCPFGGDVFALFRSWHNDRSYEPDGPWSKLTLAIAYATEAHLFITDLNQSPFNVGTKLVLEDFTVVQVAELNRRYGSPLRSDEEIARYHRLIGGQPYLTRRGLEQMIRNSLTLTALIETADQEDGVYGDHLRRLLVSLSQDPTTLESVRGLLAGAPIPDSATFYRLRSGGLLSGAYERDAVIRCDLYRAYLERRLTH